MPTLVPEHDVYALSVFVNHRRNTWMEPMTSKVFIKSTMQVFLEGVAEGAIAPRQRCQFLQHNP